MPLEQSARIESVPVGAIEVTVALRSLRPRRAGSEPGARADARHHALGERHGLVAVVGHAEVHAQVREAHHAEADLAVSAHGGGDLGEGMAADLHHVVEEAHRYVHAGVEPVEVERAVAREGVEPDRAEVAGLVREQRQLAARVGRLEAAELRRRVFAVHRVEEDHARVAAGPRALRDLVEQVARVDAAHELPVAGVYEVEAPVRLHGTPEGVGRRHRQVEVGEPVRPDLRPHELHDVRMVDAQDAHVGAAPPAALLDDRGGGVEDADERDRPRGHAVRPLDDVAGRAQAGEVEAGAAAGLVDHRHPLHRLEDALEVVVDR
jgi:hypothetical protein